MRIRTTMCQLQPHRIEQICMLKEVVWFLKCKVISNEFFEESSLQEVMCSLGRLQQYLNSYFIEILHVFQVVK